MPSRERSRRRFIGVVTIGVALLTVAAIWLAFYFLKPTPPRTVSMAVSSDGSYNAEVGKRYREFFARAGIDLKLVPTAGAVDSVARLQDPKSGVSIAIVPGGITNQKESPDLVSLGTVFYEPLWLFTRERLGTPKSLRSERISIGPDGSGSRDLSLKFLARVGIVDQKSATFLSLTPQESAEKLLSGEIDAAVLLDAWETPLVQRLLTAPNVVLANVLRADAFVALYPFLNKLVLPAGVADMINNRPPTDVNLLAPKASLLVRKDLHPAIQYLLLEAASEFHSTPGVFHTAGQFPAPEAIDFPLSTDARQFYKTGTPFLQRHLPFWLVVFVQQLVTVLIPVLGVIYPLVRYSPMIFLWVERRRIYTLYSELKILEEDMSDAGPGTAEKDFHERLDRLEGRASKLPVLTSLRPLLYEFRTYIRLVRQRMDN